MRNIFRYIFLLVFIVTLIAAPRLKVVLEADECIVPQGASQSYCSDLAAASVAKNSHMETLPVSADSPPFSMPQTPDAWGRFWLAGQLTPSALGSPCLYSAPLAWVTQHVTNIGVTLLDNQTGKEKVFDNGNGSHTAVAQIVPGQSYRFTLWDTGTQKQLDQFWVSADGLNCASNETPNVAGAITRGSFTLTGNNNYCVNQTPTYYVLATPTLAQETVYWTSSFNGQIVNQPTLTLDNNGQWIGNGNTWQTKDIGHWKKVAVVSGNAQTLEFDVKDCGNIPGTNPK